jgi:hypothetical protein
MFEFSRPERRFLANSNSGMQRFDSCRPASPSLTHAESEIPPYARQEVAALPILSLLVSLSGEVPCATAALLSPMPGSRNARACTLREEAQHRIWLDFIFRLRTCLTPSPTNGCKSAGFAPPSCPPSQGEYYDQSRRYSDVLLRQRVLCRSYSRGHNYACVTKGACEAGRGLGSPEVCICCILSSS